MSKKKPKCKICRDTGYIDDHEFDEDGNPYSNRPCPKCMPKQILYRWDNPKVKAKCQTCGDRGSLFRTHSGQKEFGGDASWTEEYPCPKCKPKTALDFALGRKVPSVFDLAARIVKLEEENNAQDLLLHAVTDDVIILKEQIKHCVFYPEENNGKENRNDGL